MRVISVSGRDGGNSAISLGQIFVMKVAWRLRVGVNRRYNVNRQTEYRTNSGYQLRGSKAQARRRISPSKGVISQNGAGLDGIPCANAETSDSSQE